MNKRLFAIIAILMIATMLLTACGSASAQPAGMQELMLSVVP